MARNPCHTSQETGIYFSNFNLSPLLPSGDEGIKGRGGEAARQLQNRSPFSAGKGRADLKCLLVPIVLCSGEGSLVSVTLQGMDFDSCSLRLNAKVLPVPEKRSRQAWELSQLDQECPGAQTGSV